MTGALAGGGIPAKFGTASQGECPLYEGQVGLLFMDTKPQEVIRWFKDFYQHDFARSGNHASRVVALCHATPSVGPLRPAGSVLAQGAASSI